jgi:hypothetical protein
MTTALVGANVLEKSGQASVEPGRRRSSQCQGCSIPAMLRANLGCRLSLTQSLLVEPAFHPDRQHVARESPHRPGTPGFWAQETVQKRRPGRLAHLFEGAYLTSGPTHVTLSPSVSIVLSTEYFKQKAQLVDCCRARPTETQVRDLRRFREYACLRPVAHPVDTAPGIQYNVTWQALQSLVGRDVALGGLCD